MSKTRKLKKANVADYHFYRKKGGKYVAYGTYGCGFSPALLCKENDVRRSNVFSKLTDANTASQEIKQYDLLHPIDPTHKYFLYPIHVCDTKPPQLPENEVEKCSIPLNYEKAKIIQMPNGGENNCTRLKLELGDFVSFFRSLRNLFEGLFVLHNNDINHCDIKPPNIVYQKNIDGSFNTRYVDFGFTFKTPTLPTLAQDPKTSLRNYNIFLADYDFFCFDVKFANPTTLVPSFFDQDLINIFYYENFLKPERLGYVRKSPWGPFFLSDQTFKIRIPEVLAKLHFYSMLPIEERHRIIFRRNDIFALGKTLSWMFYDLTGFYDAGMTELYIYSDEEAYRGDYEWLNDVKQKIVIPFYKMIRMMIDPLVPPPLIYNLVQMFDEIEYQFSIYYNKAFLEENFFNTTNRITILPTSEPAELAPAEYLAANVMAGLKTSQKILPMFGGGSYSRRPKSKKMKTFRSHK